MAKGFAAQAVPAALATLGAPVAVPYEILAMMLRQCWRVGLILVGRNEMVKLVR